MRLAHEVVVALVLWWVAWPRAVIVRAVAKARKDGHVEELAPGIRRHARAVAVKAVLESQASVRSVAPCVARVFAAFARRGARISHRRWFSIIHGPNRERVARGAIRVLLVGKMSRTRAARRATAVLMNGGTVVAVHCHVTRDGIVIRVQLGADAARCKVVRRAGRRRLGRRRLGAGRRRRRRRWRRRWLRWRRWRSGWRNANGVGGWGAVIQFCIVNVRQLDEALAGCCYAKSNDAVATGCLAAVRPFFATV